ncbi:MAG: C13 family peptidase [Candidatus Nanoarchaeia archaeon]|jgi:glycosylphosphatidylinositol transamidase (GPIT) subunit GPI8
MVIKKGVCSILSLAGLVGSLSCASMAIPSSPMHGNGPEKYAVLISGQTEERHALNMTLVYNFLLDNGYEKNNIQVLDGKGSDRLYCYPVDAAATVDNVRAAFESLESKLDKDDSLFVYVSDHGGQTYTPKGDALSTISTNDGSTLDQRTFEGFVNDLNYGLGVFIFDQCYSGGFAEETGHGNNVSIASASADESAYSGGIHNSFTAYFIKAYIFSQFSDGNLDGNVSITEAFEYADSNNPYTVQDLQQPIIRTELDAGKIFFFDDE